MDIVDIVLIAGVVVSATISSFALWQTHRTHVLINSRMDELVKVRVAEALLRGGMIGEKRERDRAERGK